MRADMEILIGTGNPHKVREIQQILHGLPVEWRTAADWKDPTDIAETGRTYEENAVIKARAWRLRSGLWTLADDSGLEVDGLGGRPGLLSARYADTNARRIDRVLQELEGKSEEERKARFVCAACLAGPEDALYVAVKTLEGRIAKGRRGREGFGYDPIFIPDGFGGRHLAELKAEEKNEISHRAQALIALRPAIEKLLAHA